MTPSTLDQIARFALLFIFAAGIVGSILRPRAVIETYELLRLPSWFSYLTALSEGVAAVLLLRLEWVEWGALLAAGIMLAAALFTFRVGRFVHLVPPIVTMALALWVAYQFQGA